MSPVLIACPDTLDLVLAGLVAESIDELDGVYTLTDCASCGGDHVWTPAEAVLADGVRP